MATHKTLRALYEYVPQEPDELALSPGQLVVGYTLTGGWWRGESQGKVGLFPGNYVEEVAAQEEAKQEDVQVSMRSGRRPAPKLAGASAAAAAAPSATRAAASPATSAAAPATSTVPVKRSTPAGGAGAAGGERKRVDTLQFALWARNMAMASSVTMVLLGPMAMLWATAEGNHVSDNATLVRPHGSVLAGVVSLLGGLAIGAFEIKFGLNHRPGGFEHRHRVSVRGALYMVLALPLCFSAPTALAAAFLLLTGATYMVGAYRQEVYDDGGAAPRAQRKGWSAEEEEAGSSDWPSRLRRMYERKQEQGELGKLLVVFLYLLLNFILWLEALVRWSNIVSSLQNDPMKTDSAPSSFAPWAKACGQALNFNCAVILLPVVRSVIKKLHNRNVANTGYCANFIPLQKNIVLHKLIAKLVMGFTIGHVVAHFINYSTRAQQTLDLFGVGPWITGGIISLAMFFIYTSATDRVRHAHYEIFWYSHHWFIIFFLFLLGHKADNLREGFWRWLLLPGLLYVVERVYRVRRGNRPLFVRTVKWIPPVMEIVFEPRDKHKFVFKEGMYLYLNCPRLSINEWHPFTISSSAGDLERDGVVSVHIKVHRGGWTERLKQYFETMNPRGLYPLELTRMDERGQVVPGKDRGVDGRPLLRVDGPHAAPSQHYDDYSCSMVVGAGIGMTPAAAIIRAVLKYKWKKGFSPNIVHFYWVCRHSEIESFQWFISKLAHLMNEVRHQRQAGNLKAHQYVELHIFITTLEPDKVATMRLRETELETQDGRVPEGGAFTTAQLFRAMVQPTTASRQFTDVMANPSAAPNRLGDIFLWNGRPDWDQIFRHVKQLRPPDSRHVGVLFCGASVIGKDLKKMCQAHSSLDDNLLFHLHKENF